jgi:hypothetical protein
MHQRCTSSGLNGLAFVCQSKEKETSSPASLASPRRIAVRSWGTIALVAVTRDIKHDRRMHQALRLTTRWWDDMAPTGLLICYNSTHTTAKSSRSMSIVRHDSAARELRCIRGSRRHWSQRLNIISGDILGAWARSPGKEHVAITRDSRQ